MPVYKGGGRDQAFLTFFFKRRPPQEAMRCRGGGQFTPPLGKVSFFGVMGSPPPKMAVLKAPPWLVKRWMGRVEAGGRFRTFWCSQKPKKQPSVFAEISFGYSQLGFLMLQSHPFHILGVQSNIKSASNTKNLVFLMSFVQAFVHQMHHLYQNGGPGVGYSIVNPAF